MKKTELRSLVREEIKSILSESSNVLSKEFGGYDDKEFLRITWKMSIDDLQKLLQTSIEDLKWLKKTSKGTLGLFNKKDAQWVTNRIKFIKQIISHKKKTPDYIPDFVKEQIKDTPKSEDPIQTSLHKAMGFEKSQGGGNRLKEKEYTFEYAFFIDANDYDYNTITVKASNEEEARKEALAQLRKRNVPVRGKLHLA